MKIKLFDETVLEAEVVEDKEILQLTIKLASRSEYSKIFDTLTDSNLSSVTVTYDDGSHSDYQNLKFVSGNLLNKSGTYYVAISITTKTAYEMAVDELTKEVIKLGEENLLLREQNNLLKTQMEVTQEAIDFLLLS